jgi:ribosomal protein S18 acetylase RimI-like enzyme
LDEALLGRVEDAGINASAPPQQRWLDGWLVRFNPGKAKRARCIQAVAQGRLPVDERLRLAALVYEAARLPLVVRITPFSLPAGLDDLLASAGFGAIDDTRVMVSQPLSTSAVRPLPAGTAWVPLAAADYAQAVGAIRGSPPEQRTAHADRLLSSPVPYQGFAIRRLADQAVLACGQFAREGDLVGLYDIATAPESRQQGLATLLCERMLSISCSQGAKLAYLQVEADNAPARHIYARLGFKDGYAYHYRVAP